MQLSGWGSRREVSKSQQHLGKLRAWREQQGIHSGLSKSTSWALLGSFSLAVKRNKFLLWNKIFRLIVETYSRSCNWSRRYNTGILAMAPLSLEKKPRKEHASHQGTFSFQHLQHQSCGRRQVPLRAVLSFHVSSPTSRPWQQSAQNPIPTPSSINSFQFQLKNPSPWEDYQQVVFTLLFPHSRTTCL